MKGFFSVSLLLRHCDVAGPQGGGGKEERTPVYGLYRYVPRDRVWFLRSSIFK